MQKTIILILVTCLLCGCGTVSVPVRSSDAHLRTWLLAKTPLGSGVSAVRPVLIQNGWLGAAVHQQPPVINGEVGEYQSLRFFPFFTEVWVRWEFDHQDRLREVRISRIPNVP